MIEPTRIGFSTTDALLSRLIRRLTRSRVSHAWLVYRDVDFEREMVMEAVGTGFRIVPLDKFAQHNRIVEIVTPRHPIDEGLKAAVDWLGEGYDTKGLVGMGVLLLLRAVRRRTRRIRNLFSNPRALFCSEAVARACLACAYPGFERDPESTTPQDLYAFFEAERRTAPPPALASSAEVGPRPGDAAQPPRPRRISASSRADAGSPE